MISAHADLVAAIDLAERHIVASVDVDWFSDDADNLVTNPTFEVDASGWINNGFLGDVSTSARSVTRSHSGRASLAVTWPTTSVGSEHGTFVATTAGRTYLAQIWAFVPAGNPLVDIDVFVLGAGDAVTATGEWQLLRKVFVATGSSHFVAIRRLGSITAGQQVFIDDVRCVPYLNLAALVGTVRVSRSLSAALPDIAGIATGDISAEASVELAGIDISVPDSTSVARLLNPFNAESPMWRRDRSGRPVTIEIGMMTASGERRVTRFTGLTRSTSVDPVDGTVEVTALDYAELLRAPTTLPTIIGSAVVGGQTYRPGLNVQWVIDYMLRQNNIYATPAERQSCVLSATLHGSAAAEIGTLVYAYDSTTDNTVGYVDAAWALGTYDASTFPGTPIDSRYGDHVGWSARWLVENTGLTSTTLDGMLIEAWVYLPGSSITRDILTVESDPLSGSRQKLVIRLTTAFVLDWYTTAGGSAVTVTGPTLTYDSAWHYLAILVSWPATTTVRATFRVDGTSTTPGDGTVVARTTQTAMTHVTVTSGLSMEALQVTSETTASMEPFHDEFVPSADLEASLLELTVTPEISSGASVWDTMKSIAEAESAIVGFTEQGLAIYRNRRIAPAAPGRTVTASRSLFGISTVERVDSIRNRIRVPVTGYTVQVATWIWVSGDVVSVPGRSSTTVIAEFANPVVGLATTFVVAPVGNNTANKNGYRAARKADGTGGAVTNLTFTITTLGTSSAKIVVSNPNSYAAFLVSPTGAGYPSTSDGNPSFELWGQPITRTSAEIDAASTNGLASDAVAEALWQPSIDLRGEQLLDVSASEWRQQATDAQSFADDLLALLHRPVPVLESVTVAGDPTIQLGDRVILSDTEGTGIDDPVIVVSIDDVVSESDGYGQTLTVRLVAPPGGWILGYPGRSTLGVSTRL